MSDEQDDELIRSLIIKASPETEFIGIDEVGTGCLAGDVFVCAVRAPKDWSLTGARDSKKLTPKKRAVLSARLHELKESGTIEFSIQQGSVDMIDSMGINHAVHELYWRAVKELATVKTAIYVDGNRFQESRYEYTAFVKGDDLIPHISAASILAKVARDTYMMEQHDRYPDYDFKSNKGYGTARHLKALIDSGVTPLHRRSYEPIKTMTGWER